MKDKMIMFKQVLSKYIKQIDIMVNDYGDNTEESNYRLQNYMEEMPYHFKEVVEEILK